MGLASVGTSAGAPGPSLQQALADLKVPLDWIASTPVHWDTNKPWKDARLEIRRLLALDDASVRQGVKLTWLYAQKGDIGDGHELPMYLFMSGNYAWAMLEYPKYLKKVAGTGATHAYRCYASCLAHFGEYTQALHVIDEAMNDLAILVTGLYGKPLPPQDGAPLRLAVPLMNALVLVAVLALGAAQPSGKPPPTSDVSGNAVKATGSSATRTLRAPSTTCALVRM